MRLSSLLLLRSYSLFAVCAASVGVTISIVWLCLRLVRVTRDPVPLGSSHPCHAIAVAMLTLSQSIVPHPWLWRPSLRRATPLVVALSPHFSRLALPFPLRSSLTMFSTLGNLAPPAGIFSMFLRGTTPCTPVKCGLVEAEVPPISYGPTTLGNAAPLSAS